MAVTRKRKAEAEGKSVQSDSGENKSSQRAKKEPKSAESKQKSEPDDDQKDEEKGDEKSSDTITINRAPVLELWSACLTQSEYPDLSWTTCLSVGGAISTLCAISKGRAIGAIDKPDEETAEKRRQERESKSTTDEVDVMHFNIKVEKGVALVGNKPKKANESALKHKFGEDDYAATKQTFDKAIGSWKDDQSTLDSKAFHMYEQFRPSVPKGQRGWGRQGQLRLQTVRNIVMKT